MTDQKIAWITWERQIRNVSMSTALNVPLFELLSNKKMFSRYFSLIKKTVSTIRTQKLTHVFVQNPSIILTSTAIFLKFIFNIKVCIDAHNSGVFPLENRFKILTGINKYLLKKADLVIVSNIHLANTIKPWGVNVIDMCDPIPDMHKSELSLPPQPPYVLFICSWAADEPYLEVIEAAKKTPHLGVYFTGNYKKVLTETVINNLPDNVKLLGYVSESEYTYYFSNSIGVIDLTTRDNCLVCGAYEAISLRKAAIISDSLVNREVFKRGFIYTENNAPAIQLAILDLEKNHEALNLEMESEYHEMKINMENKITVIKQIFMQ